MSKITEEIAKEYREEVKKAEEERKKNIINIRWEQYVKLSNKVYEIIKELRDYDFFGKGLTKEESSKMADLVACHHAFQDKIGKALGNEQQFSEIMEKLYSIVQEALDFLEKIRMKYGSLEDVKARNAAKDLLIDLGLVIGIFAFAGIITWLAIH